MTSPPEVSGKTPQVADLIGLLDQSGRWDHWEHEGQVIESCIIITTDANPRVADMIEPARLISD